MGKAVPKATAVPALHGLTARDPLPPDRPSSAPPSRPPFPLPSSKTQTPRLGSPKGEGRKVHVAFGSRAKAPIPAAEAPPPRDGALSGRGGAVPKGFVPRVASLKRPDSLSPTPLPPPRPPRGRALPPATALRPSPRQLSADTSPYSVPALRRGFLQDVARAAGLLRHSPAVVDAPPVRPAPDRRRRGLCPPLIYRRLSPPSIFPPSLLRLICMGGVECSAAPRGRLDQGKAVDSCALPVCASRSASTAGSAYWRPDSMAHSTRVCPRCHLERRAC